MTDEEIEKEAREASYDIFPCATRPSFIIGYFAGRKKEVHALLTELEEERERAKKLEARLKELIEAVEKHKYDEYKDGEDLIYGIDAELYQALSRAKACDDPGEEDGPWAEGWEERKGGEGK